MSTTTLDRGTESSSTPVRPRSPVIGGAAILGRRSVTLQRRNPAAWLGAIAFPLLFFGLFHVVMGEIMAAQGFDYDQLLPSTVVVQACLFTGMSSAGWVAEDRLNGFGARLRAMPIGRIAPLLGRSVADLARSLLSTTVLVAVGMVVGMRFRAGLVWLPVYVAVALYFALAISLAMGLLGHFASSPGSAMSMASVPYLPLLMLSSGFSPVEDFPGFLRPFVANQPVTATIDALRAVAGDGDISAALTRSLAWSTGLVLLFGMLAFRRMGRVT